MEVELGKLFIGGISWDTNEDRLREYFQAFGEVVEAVIMKDRATGRARGFGFVVFADPAVAERVVMEKHLIDGRNVEAKKAVPREDQNILNRVNGNGHGSPGPARTKKIFVGGLASTVTESDFKNYFDQFGMITDVVVMYDHNTQRPRGFGFITFDSEDAVDRVLCKTFHELNGKMVEVKRAVPKELSPGPTRSQLGGQNYMASKVSNFVNAYAQGYSSSSLGGYGFRMDGRFSLVSAGRNNISPIGSGFGMGLNFEQGLSPCYDGNSNLGSNAGYGRLSPSYGGNSSWYGSPMGYNESNGRSSFLLNSAARNLWGNESIKHNSSSMNSGASMGSGGGNPRPDSFGSTSNIWGSSVSPSQGGSSDSFNSKGNIGYRNGDVSVSIGGRGFGRSNGTNINPVSSQAVTNVSTNGSYEGTHDDSFFNDLFSGDSAWKYSPLELERVGSFGYHLGNGASDVLTRSTAGYVGGYTFADRQSNRGIAA